MPMSIPVRAALSAGSYVPPPEIADAFLASRWAGTTTPVDVALRAFLAELQGPVSTVPQYEFDQTLDLLLSTRRTPKGQIT